MSHGGTFALDLVHPQVSADVASISQPDPARRLALERACEDASERSDQAAELWALVELGLVDQSEGLLPQAAKRYIAAIRLAKEIGDRASEAVALHNLGTVLVESAMTAEALAHFRLAAQAAYEAGAPQLLVMALSNAAAMLAELGRYDEAIDDLQHALVFFAAPARPAQIVGLLQSVKVLLLEVGRDDFASFAKLAGIQAAQVGAELRSHGHDDAALDYFRVSVRALEEAGDPGQTTRARASLGQTLAKLDRPTDALTELRIALVDARSLGDRVPEAIVVGAIAKVHWAQNRPAETLAGLMRALHLIREADSPYDLYAALVNVGDTLILMNRTEEALEYLLEASAEGGPASAADRSDVLAALGRAHMQLGQNHEALAAFAEAAGTAAVVGNVLLQVDALKELGSLLERTYEHEKAERVLREALVIAEGDDDLTSHGIANDALGKLLHRTGRTNNALHHFERSLAIARQLGDAVNECSALNSLGQTLLQLGRARSSLEHHELALKMTGDAPPSASKAVAGIGRARALSALGRFSDALDAVSAALHVARGLGDVEIEAHALNETGAIQRRVGRPGDALDSYRAALALVQRLGDPRSEGPILNNIGEAFYLLGRLGDALDHYGRALAMARRTHDRRGEGTALDNLARLLQALERPDEAIARYSEAITIRRTVGDLRGHGDSAHNLASLLDKLGNHDDALRLLETALAIARNIHDRQGEAATLSYIAGMRRDLGDHRSAMRTYQDALSAFVEMQDAHGQCATLIGLGAVLDVIGDYDAAADALAQAHLLATAIGSRGLEAQALFTASRIQTHLGFGRAALDLMAGAVSVLESLRVDAGPPDLRASAFAGYAHIYAEYLALLVDAAENAPDVAAREEFVGRAFAASESRRARMFLDGLGEARAGVTRGVDPALRLRERELHEHIRASSAQLRALIVDSSNEDAATKLRDSMRSSEQELWFVEAEIRVRHPAYAALTQPQAASIRDIRNELLVDDRTALVEYVIDDAGCFVFVVTQQSVLVRRLGDAGALSSLCHSLVEQVTSLGGFSLDARALYEALVAPIATCLAAEHIERLLLTADGALHRIPFSILMAPAAVDSRAPGRYLCDVYTCLGLSSATAAVAQRREQRPDGPSSGSASLLAFGDPRSGSAGHRIPGTGLEVATIAQLFDPDAPTLDLHERLDPRSMRYTSSNGHVRIQTGEYATKTAFLDALDRAHYRYVHLATHATADPERPLLSRIEFSRDDAVPDDSPDLHALELLDTRMPCELCVLAACNTGSGQLITGEGIVGLWRAFAFAGAERLCLSLWSVADDATLLLMECLYRHLVRGLEPASALRQAQRDARRQFPHPYYWAGFYVTN